MSMMAAKKKPTPENSWLAFESRCKLRTDNNAITNALVFMKEFV